MSFQQNPGLAASISIVVPVYRGEHTLRPLIQEILPLTRHTEATDGRSFVVSEVILVHDCGPDRSQEVIRQLAVEHFFVKPVWLSRNYGQHAATLAGMASALGDYVVTIDEDGQQNPAEIAAMFAHATEGVQVVYGKPIAPPPHGWFRNGLSYGAKRIATVLLGAPEVARFNSFRLIDGEIARSLAAYCGSGVYLDIALFWVTARVSYCPTNLRPEIGPGSGYSLPKLFRHFWQLLLTSGTRPLRLITVMGFCSMTLAIFITISVIWDKFHTEIPVRGWASLVIVVAFFSGCILVALGVLAEYLAQTMTIVMGKPLYLVCTKPTIPVPQVVPPLHGEKKVRSGPTSVSTPTVG